MQGVSSDKLKGHWFKHIEDAYLESKQSNKPILALFTGSDWCKPCKELEENLLNTPEFEEWAQENVILLYLDYPINASKSEEYWKHANGLRNQLSPKGFPNMILFDATKVSDSTFSFTEHGRIIGFEKTDTTYLEQLNAIIDASEN